LYKELVKGTIQHMVIRTMRWLKVQLLLCLVGAFTLIAVLSSPAALAIARGYTTDDTGLQAGMVAALSSEGDSKIQRATQDNSQRIIGIVTTFEDSSVTVASSATKALVESDGEVNAYVSDMGGKVTKGSLLAVSSLKGVLMKVPESTSARVIAVAAEDSSASNSDEIYNIGDSSKTTHIAKIKVNLSLQGSSTGQGNASSPLADLGKAVVGKDVGEIRVLVALILFVIVLIAEGGILYGAISSAITALGRNPLARKVIRREMIRVIIVALAVLLVGLGAVYTVLWI
jgi:hypothetical protein